MYVCMYIYIHVMVPLGVTNMSRGDQGRMNLFCIFQYKSTRSHMQSKRNKMLTDLGKILPWGGGGGREAERSRGRGGG